MVFESFSSAHLALLVLLSACAFIVGFVIRKTNFCTMGAISDWVVMRDTGRLRSWALAATVAMLGMVLLESLGVINLDTAYPAYRRSEFIWVENLLGGILFGIGMTLASGCGSKLLVRIGGGNFKSIIVVGVIGIVAYYMGNPLPGTDKTLYSLLFHGWLRPFAVELPAQQDLGTLLAGESGADTARLVIGLLLGSLLLAVIFFSRAFRGNRDNIVAGVVIGLTVIAAWVVSNSITISVDDEAMALSTYVQEWEFVAETDAQRPASSKSLNPHAITIINPIGQSYGYLQSAFDQALLTSGICMVLAIILGSLAYSLWTSGFRIEWFSSMRDFVLHLAGGVLMGMGGVLAMGCTIGQAVTGVSTLSAGSFIVVAGIVLGSVLTVKVRYYMVVYAEEASFTSSLVSSLADLNLFPDSLRRLNKV